MPGSIQWNLFRFNAKSIAAALVQPEKKTVRLILHVFGAELTVPIITTKLTNLISPQS